MGFSGDVNYLNWADLAYQPYFSATASNVLFPFWSHDIEGARACSPAWHALHAWVAVLHNTYARMMQSLAHYPLAFVGGAENVELYVRWIQVGAFSGVMRSHDRGMSGGGCANSYTQVVAPAWGPATGDCSIVQPWSVGPMAFPAIRAALQARERLLPYIYNTHRTAFGAWSQSRNICAHSAATAFTIVSPPIRSPTRRIRDGYWAYSADVLPVAAH